MNMEVDDNVGVVPIGDDGPVNNSVDTDQGEDETPDEDISAPTSRTEYSNAISGFLILNWRSPLTPSHVSVNCLMIFSAYRIIELTKLFLKMLRVNMSHWLQEISFCLDEDMVCFSIFLCLILGFLFHRTCSIHNSFIYICCRLLKNGF